MKFQMRTDWPDIAEPKKIELQHILGILKKIMHFDRAILYGHYAGGRMRSELRGYELLLITCRTPEKEGWELESLLNQAYRHEIREVAHIHIETTSITDMNSAGTKSWFYTNVRNEGIILFENKRAQPVFPRGNFNNSVAYKKSKQCFNYFFGTGSDLLDVSERLWNDGKSQVASIQLSYATLFLLRAVEMEYYGNQIKTTDLQVIYRRCRHFSRELLAEFPLTEIRNINFWREMTELRHKPLQDSRFILCKTDFNKHLRRLRILQNIVLSSCERHLFYLQHGKTEKQMKLEADAQALSMQDDQSSNLMNL